ARDFGGAQQSESEPGRQDSFRNADRPQSILRLNGACGLKMRGDMRLWADVDASITSLARCQ
ncbi:hypothetical protein AiwAL_19860, partial [Acidiphilium sp. AL]|uniref:hypothetical protein n=1 Tax=Acidiphilium sp. AL TaxID=2871704 RepID=UPI0021CB23EF